MATKTPPRPGYEIWDLSGDDQTGWYAEGYSPKSEGWFCMEFSSYAEAQDELKELGFTIDEIKVALEEFNADRPTV